MASLTKPPFGGENHLLSQRCMFSDYFWLQNPRIPVFLGGKTWVKDVFVFFKKTSKLKFGRFQIGRYDTIKSEFLGTWAFSKDFGMRWVGLVFFLWKKKCVVNSEIPWKKSLENSHLFHLSALTNLSSNNLAAPQNRNRQAFSTYPDSPSKHSQSFGESWGLEPTERDLCSLEVEKSWAPGYVVKKTMVS